MINSLLVHIRNLVIGKTKDKVLDFFNLNLREQAVHPGDIKVNKRRKLFID